ncbi:MAG: hypothetical protein AB2541_02460, partial [Candidatus Thiodiazotropha sp.]
MCGLKSRTDYPDFSQFFSAFDMICFVETKLDDTDIVSLPGFQCLSQPRKQHYLRKSGGIAFFVKEGISEYCKQKESVSDYIMWICVDKKLTQTDENLVLGIIYVPPSQSRFFNDDELLNLENEISSVCRSNKYVIITGDINARTAKLSDYVKLDDFFSNMFNFDNDTVSLLDKTEVLESQRIPLRRNSKDAKTNNAGYWLIDLCKFNNLFIVNGRVGEDKAIGEKTFRDKSVIDYTLCTADCFSMLKQFEVVEVDPIFSDGHSLLKWSLLADIPLAQTVGRSLNNTHSHLKWSDNANEDFMNNI